MCARATAKQSTCTCPKEPTPAYGHPSKEGSRTYPLSGKEPTPAYGHPSKEGSSTHPLSILAIEKTSGISYYTRVTCI